jgi:hypothetical protein
VRLASKANEIPAAVQVENAVAVGNPNLALRKVTAVVVPYLVM